ncbi:winged helix-turn-helix transcriptional regulator [Rhodoligotrophos defluvii]|uniref:winged helix-turn-helix transcriptional regulator n=1 Tax=Rhodoligotrophos defluvii TaxID=2561934 RepID=UPI0010C95824|nr:helix-turn-helix domain-containing protein [Rhodoligotrophos defluvii]
MKTYGQFCPVAKTAEIFAERWTPLIIRELCFGPRRFNELRAGLPQISRTLLSQRLRELEAAAVIVSMPKSSGVGRIYRLTEAGEAFRPIIELMGAWSQRWDQGRIGPDDLDPGLLMWSMRRQIRPEAMPSSQFVIQFEFFGMPRRANSSRYWWLVLCRPDVDVCQKNPGYDVDIVVYADLAAFTRLWTGELGLDDLRAENTVMLQGSEDAQRIAVRALDLKARPAPKAFLYQGTALPEDVG